MSGFNAPRRGFAGLLIPCLILLTPGCAAIVKGKSQAIRLQTQTPGQVVYHEGRRVQDGDLLIIQKDRGEPYVQNAEGVREYLDYELDPWLIGDGLLLIPFVLPGVVALAVDFGMGTWRDVQDPQVVQYVSTPEHLAPLTPLPQPEPPQVVRR